jgi:hypothetical protein
MNLGTDATATVKLRLVNTASGGVDVQTVSARTDVAWTFVVPSAVSVGSAYNVVITYGSTEVVSSGTSGTLTIIAAPPPPPSALTITSFSPTSGNPTTTIVTVSGSGFGATQGSSLLQLTATVGGQTQNVTPATWSATSITFAIPSFLAGTYQVKVVVGEVTATAPTNLTINAQQQSLTIEARDNQAINVFGAGATILKNTASIGQPTNGTKATIVATAGTFGSNANVVKVTLAPYTSADCMGSPSGPSIGSGGPAQGLFYSIQSFTSTVIPIVVNQTDVVYTGPFRFNVSVNNGTPVATQCLNLANQ